MKEILFRLSQGPEGDIDAGIAKKLHHLSIVGYTAKDIKDILDECVHSALASSFVIKTLDLIWQKALEEENDDI